MKYIRIIAVFYLIGWALLWLVGCKSSQNIDASTQKGYTSEVNNLSAQMDSLLADFRIEQQKMTDKLSNLKVEHTTTYYTSPDSTGRQYPVYVSTTKADKDERTTEQLYTEMNATFRRLEQKIDMLAETVNSLLKEQQKVVELSWWDLHKWQVSVGALVVILIVVGYMVYKLKKGG